MKWKLKYNAPVTLTFALLCAVALALNPEDCFVPGLDLWGVSEFKRGNGGSVEIKFADRVKAIALLLECMGGGEDGMAALIEALES